MSAGRLALATALVAALSRPARAEEPSEALVYGVAATELAVGGWLAGDLFQSGGAGLALNFAPVVIGGGAALGAWALELDARPGLAAHGAVWGGAFGLLAGALSDGRSKRFGLRAGTATYLLGGLGALAGGALGAIAVDDADEATWWLAAPPAGFAAGGLVLGIAFMAIGGFDGDRAPGQMAAGALIGLTAGLGLATYMAVRDDGDPDAMPVARGARRVSLFSLGGAF